MWLTALGIGLISLIIEIFFPSLFFLNFALAAFVCAGISCFVTSIPVMITIFCLLSILFIITLRPFFLRKALYNNVKTGMEEKYIGKTAKVVECVDKNSGVVTIYDERWQARNIEDGTIEPNCLIEIVSHEGIILKVKKID